MQTVPVGIIGASGYSGLEASRILAFHPHVELRLLASDRWQGESAARRAGIAGSLKYAPQEKALELGRECAAVLLATPADVSLELAPKLLEAGVRLGALSGAFPLAAPPPLQQQHPLRAKRGILARRYPRLGQGRRADELASAFVQKYADEPFLEVLGTPDEVSLKGVVGTNKCQLAVASDGEMVIVVSAIDNLLKGAAGQAVQNLNLSMGWPETAGLDTLRGSHP